MIKNKTVSNTNSSSTTKTTFVVQSKTINEDIEQTSVITPLTHALIVSPVSGFITQQITPYGSDVSGKDDKIFIVSDVDLSTDVFNKIVDYYNAKWDYESNKNKYFDYKLQFKSGLVAEEDVKLKEIEYYRADMKLVQSEFELKKLLIKLINHLIN